ncbi:leucyl aminopeptidase [Candidatus Peregrinibacteria bacterium]|nr:leucyl aminopeptidase [Candidatus Peregrinibacteria bacterium]
MNSFLIIPIFEKIPPRVGTKAQNLALKTLLRRLANVKEFEPKEGRIFYLYEKKQILLGLGNAKKINVGAVLSAFGAAAKTAKNHSPQKLSIVITEELLPFTQSIAEAISLSNYQPSAAYKTGKAVEKLKRERIAEIIPVFNKALPRDQVEIAKKNFLRGIEIAKTANEVKDWVNAPPNFATPQFFDELAKKISKETGSHLTILYKKDLQKLGLNALLAVNRGSQDEPRLIILEYIPKDADKNLAPLALVGKGVIFDSGGYNLKPRGHIEDMQLDKAGACAVLGLAKLLPKLNLKQRVIIAAPITESLIGSRAFKPSEILKTYTGKTVEITNTDGEGRLILADAIAYIIDKFKPKFLINIATLTGACVIALGDRYAGLFGNDKDLIENLRKAGEETDELLWPLPIHKDHSEKMKGVYADLRNADLGSERYAGASKGAAFIKEFIGKTPWAHIDIAAPAFTKDPKKYEQKGATAFGLRALVRFLEKLA